MQKTDRPPSFYEYLTERRRVFFQAIESVKSHKNFIFVELCYFLFLAVLLLLFFPEKTNEPLIVITAFLILMGILFFSIGKFEFSASIIKIDCKTFILLGLIFWLILDPLFLRGKISSFSGELISNVFLMIFIFIIFFYVGYLIKLPSILGKMFSKLEGNYPIDRKKLFYVVLFLLILALLPLIIWGGGIKQVIWELTHSGRFTSGWTRARMGGGFEDSFKTLFYFIQYIGLFLVFYFFLTEKNNFVYFINDKLKGIYEGRGPIRNIPARLWGLLKNIGSFPRWVINAVKSLISDPSNLRGAVLVFLSLILLWIILDAGSRLNLGIVLLGFVAVAFLDSFNKNKNLVYVLTVIFVILLCLMQFQLIYRNLSPDEIGTYSNSLVNNSYKFGTKYYNHLSNDIRNFSNLDLAHLNQDISFFKEDFGHVKKFGSKVFNSIFYKISNSFRHSRDDQFYSMLRFSENVPDKIPHTNQWLIFKPAYHFIPRTLWQDKPDGAVEFFHKQIDPKESEIMTVAVSIICEFYLVQGFFGVILIALFLGILARQLDALKGVIKRSPAILLIYCFGLIVMFATIRSYLVFTEMLYVFIGLFILLILIKYLDGVTNYISSQVGPVLDIQDI